MRADLGQSPATGGPSIAELMIAGLLIAAPPDRRPPESAGGLTKQAKSESGNQRLEFLGDGKGVRTRFSVFPVVTGVTGG
jgi:hypothetical protein